MEVGTWESEPVGPLSPQAIIVRNNAHVAAIIEVRMVQLIDIEKQFMRITLNLLQATNRDP